MRCLALSLLSFVLAVAPAPPTRADEQAADAPSDEQIARTAYDRGMQLYRERSFEAAADAFADSFARDPRRETLFARAQAMRLAGHCEQAVPLYEQFLRTDPPAQQIEATRLALLRCADRPPVVVPPTAEAPKAAVEAPPAVVQEPVAAAPSARVPAPAPPERRRSFDWTSASLLAGGAVVAGVGVALIASARNGADPRAGESLGAYADRRDGAETRLRVGVAALSAGAAVALGGLLRSVWIAAHPRGAEIALQGRF